MRIRTLTLAGALLALALVLGAGPVAAKKPAPPPPPEPEPDPAIAFVGVVEEGKGKNKTVSQAVMVMNADGTNVTVVYKVANTLVTGVDWSPDGDRLVFTTRYARSGTVHLIDVDGTNHTEIVTGIGSGSCAVIGSPAWSPGAVPGVGDSVERIAFTARDFNDDSHVYLVDTDGSDLVRLVYETGLSESHPTWSPCGTKLAFKATDPDVRDSQNRMAQDLWGLYDFSADELTLDQLEGALAGSSAYQPSWAKNRADLIAWSANGDIWVVDLDDPSSPTRLTGPADQAEQVAPSWSPDDSQIAFRNDDWSEGSITLQVMDADGANRTVILTEGMRPVAEPVWRR
jgi:Tol biopolymer transport system component